MIRARRPGAMPGATAAFAAAGLSVAIGLVLACGSDRSEPRAGAGGPAALADDRPGRPGDTPKDAGLTDTTRDHLEALGYIEVTEDPVDPSRGGVVLVDGEQAQPGYSLYCNHNEGRAEIIDLEGRRVHAWEAPNTRHWASCKLLPNGDLLVVGTDLDPAKPRKKVDEQRYLMLQSWSGQVRWRRRIAAHHHAALTPDGDILTLGLRYRRVAEVHPTADIREDFLLLLSRDGEEKGRRSLLEAFGSQPDVFAMQPVEPVHKWGRVQVDLVHANTAEFMRYPHLEDRHPLYASGNVLVTSRLQNAVAVVEWRTNRLVWAWGPGELIGPHDATMLENGNILLLDNGDEARGWSRVVEFEPVAGRIVWSYRASEPRDFFTVARGSCQRLPNGNTLITDSNHGRAFEVTPAGEIVWDFLNPHLSSENKRPSMRRVERYLPEYVEPILARFEPFESGHVRQEVAPATTPEL